MKRGERLLLWSIPLILICLLGGLVVRRRSGADSPQECANIFIQALKTHDDNRLVLVTDARTHDRLIHLNRDEDWPLMKLHQIAQREKLSSSPDTWPILQKWAAGISDRPVKIRRGHLFQPMGQTDDGGAYWFANAALGLEITQSAFGTWRITNLAYDTVH